MKEIRMKQTNCVPVFSSLARNGFYELKEVPGGNFQHLIIYRGGKLFNSQYLKVN